MHSNRSNRNTQQLRSILQTVPPGSGPHEAPRIEGNEHASVQAKDSA